MALCDTLEAVLRRKEQSRLSVRHLRNTWRHPIDAKAPTVSRADLLAYLNPFAVIEREPPRDVHVGRGLRVLHREDLQTSFAFADGGPK